LSCRTSDRELPAGAKTSHWIWYAAEPGPQLAMVAAHADGILAAAAAQGYLRCAYTEDQIRRSHA